MKNLKLGGLTADEIKSRRPEYFSLDYQKAKFISNDTEYPAVCGYFKGIGSNTFDWEGQKITKFIVYLDNGENTMQIETGMNTWITYQLMNLLLSCNGSLSNGAPVVTISLAKTESKKTSLFMDVNGKYVKYKFKFADMKFPEEKSAREKHLAKVIEKWYKQLIETYQFNPVEMEVDEDDSVIPF